MSQITRTIRWKLCRISHGSKWSACRMKPTTIDSRISRTTTDSGGPPKNLFATLSVIRLPKLASASIVHTKHALQGLEPIGVARRLVPTQPVDAGKTHGEAGFVARGALQTFESHLEHQALLALVHDLAHRAEPVDRVATNEAVDLGEFGVGKAEIGLSDGDELIAALAPGPHAERIVGIEGRALAVSALRIHQHRVDHERIAFPFPPQAFGPARNIGRIATLDHHALDRVGIRAGAGWVRT